MKKILLLLLFVTFVLSDTVFAQSWMESSSGGFGDVNNNKVRSTVVYNNRLYMGVNNSVTGAEIWENDGTTWSQICTDGFGDATNTSVLGMAVYGSNLYIGTGWSGAKVWKYDGISCSQVNTTGFGDINNETTGSMGVYNSHLYVGTNNIITGAEAWRCSVCDGSDWTQVNTDGFGDINNTMIQSTTVYNNQLYMGTAQEELTWTGTEIWRCTICDGSDWTQVNADGFGNGAINLSAHSMAVYANRLYVGDAEVWEYDGTTWTQVCTDGIGDTYGNGAASVIVYNNLLYIGTEGSGAGVWEYDGTSCSQISTDGFGDVNNRGARSLAVYNNLLYAGTTNSITGTEVWEFDGISIPQVSGSRSLPSFAAANTDINVSITIDVDEGNAPNGVIVNETLPPGWTVNSATPAPDSCDAGILGNTADPCTGGMNWVFFGTSGVVDRVITYNIHVPDAEILGTVRSFNGSLEHNNPNGDPVTVAINDLITIGYPFDPYDTNQDRIIGNFELLDAIDDWANGLLGNFELLDLIDMWAFGSYCWDTATESSKAGTPDANGAC